MSGDFSVHEILEYFASKLEKCTIKVPSSQRTNWFSGPACEVKHSRSKVRKEVCDNCHSSHRGRFKSNAIACLYLLVLRRS